MRPTVGKKVIKVARKKKTTNFKMRVGTKIIRQLSTAFYPDLTFVFDELVSNARDAMATSVKVHVGEDVVTVEDNGEGMDREELQKFFYISHTGKSEGEEKIKGNMKRKIIGKFGIGKLSMYRICGKFAIVSWRDGRAYGAEFDFEELEKKEFIDQFDLKTEELGKYSSGSRSGTKIILSKLKPTGVTARDVKRSLQKRMPLAPDFVVYVSGVGLASEVKLRSEDLMAGANVYKIEGNVPKVGIVNGSIAFLGPDTKRGQKKERSGVYIRVLGRIVNYKTAPDEIDFRDMTHGHQFYRSVIVEVNADGLGKVVLTNRAGFDKESEEWKEFKKWLWFQIDRCVDLEYKSWGKDSQNIEKNIIPGLTERFIKNSIEASTFSKKIMEEKIGTRKPTKSRRGKVRKPAKRFVQDTDSWSSVLSTSGLKFDVLTEERGIEEPEARFDKRSKTVYINTLHPMYIFARKKGKLTGALYHSLKAAVVCLALNTARNLKEFEYLYNELTIGAGSIVTNVRLKRTKSSLIPIMKKSK